MQTPAPHTKIALVTLALAALALSACTPQKPRVVGVDPPRAKAAEPGSKTTKKAAPGAAVDAAPKGEAAVEEAEPSYAYSPFLIKVRSRTPFRVISFKDVGLKLEKDEANLMYETLAEALSLEIQRNRGLGMRTMVTYDESNLDPSNHLACGSDQLYVDVWRSKAPERWGFSLWSGCGEDDNFAWKELEVGSTDSGDMAADVQPLAAGIVSTLHAASRKGCYQKAC